MVSQSRVLARAPSSPTKISAILAVALALNDLADTCESRGRQLMRALRNDFVTSRIARLKGQKQREYATAQWAWLNDLGPMPNPKQFEIGRREAHTARIMLATLK